MNLQQLKKAVEKNGGASLTSDLKDATLENGYMVSLAGYEFKTSLQALSSELLEDYKEIARDKGAYVGLWIDNDDLYVDLSINIHDKEEALKLAHENKQLAIYHIEKGATVYV